MLRLRLRLLPVAALLVLIFSESLFAAEGLESSSETSDSNSRLVISLQGFRSDNGVVWLNIFDQAKGFPGGKEVSRIHRRLQIRDHTAYISIDNLTPGIYAFNFIHDEDGNGKLNRNLVGMPCEGYGFSNNLDPRKSLHLPGFDDACFEVLPGVNTITADVLY